MDQRLGTHTGKRRAIRHIAALRLLVAAVAAVLLGAGFTTAAAVADPIVTTSTFSGDAAEGVWTSHRLEVARPGQLEVVLDWDNATANLNLYLKDPSGAMVATAVGGGRPETLSWEANTTGRWVIGLKAPSGSSPYTVTATLTSEPGGPPADGSIAAHRTTFGFPGHAGAYPYGMDWDATDDTVLVADVWNHRVLRYDSNGNLLGVVSRHARSGELGGTNEPFDVEAGPDGHVWVANQASSRIVEFDHDGNWVKTIGLGGGPEPWQSYDRGCGAGKMHWPTHLLVHPQTRDIYVSDPFCKTVTVFDSTGRWKFDFDIDLTDVGIFQPTVRGIDIDADGNIYVVEHNSRRIIRFDSLGNRTGISDRQADMNDPRGLAVDSTNGLIYVVGAFHQEVFQFRIEATERGSAFVKKWSGPAPGVKYHSIRWPAVDGDGDVYIGDTWGYRVWKSDKDGSSLPWATSAQPPPNGGFNQNNGIGIDHARNKLYVVDTFENRAQRFSITNNSGAVSRCVSTSDCPAFDLAWGSRLSPQPNKPVFNYPRGLAFGGEFVFIESSNAIAKYDRDGGFLQRFGDRGTEPGQFMSGPRGLKAVASPGDTTTGTVYATDQGNCRLQLFSFTGDLQAHMGSCGAGPNQMRGPWGLSVRGDSVFVADAGNNRVVEWSVSARQIVRVFDGPYLGQSLRGPRGVTVDPSGQWLYISDSGHRRVIRVSPDESVSELVTKGADTEVGSLRSPENLELMGDLLFVSDNNKRVYAFRLPGVTP